MNSNKYSKPVILVSKLLKSVYFVLLFFIVLYAYGNFQEFLDMTQKNLLLAVAGISLAGFLLSICLFFLFLFSIFTVVNSGLITRLCFSIVSILVTGGITLLASGIVVFASGTGGGIM